MKKLLFLSVLILTSSLFVINSAWAQAPQKFNYQAVARDADGKALVDAEVTLRIAIMSEVDTERPLYAEEHVAFTNRLGLFNLQIGAGEVLEGSMHSIDWGASSHYLSVQLDTEGFGNFQQMGTSQLLSVPYALYAEQSGSSSNGDNGRSDPNDWTMSGNAGTDDSNDFIGTTDAQDLAFRTNDNEVARFTTDGNLDLADGSSIQIASTTFLSERTGTRNVSLGRTAGQALTSGSSYNVMLGHSSGKQVTSGRQNTLVGYESGESITTSYNNSFIGAYTGHETSTGVSNTFIGSVAGFENTTGNFNLYLGVNAGRNNETGSNNVAIGNNSGQNNTASDNLFVGRNSFYNNTTGTLNAGIGYKSGYNTTTGNGNMFIGYEAGITNTTGSNNTYIGYQADGSEDLTNAMAIGAFATVSQDSSIVLGNGANVGIGTSAPDAKLHVEGTFKLVDGNQTDGYVLTSDADGNASWQTPSSGTDDQTLSLNSDTLRIDGGNWISLGTFWDNTDNQDLSISGNTLSIENGNSVEITTDTLTIVSDGDGDTKIQVEESADEDVIRFDVGGTEQFAMVGPTLEVLNTGSSVFIGDNAGANDDLSNNQNVFVGNNAGSSSTTASACVAVGTGALLSNSTSGSNTAIGYHALYSTTSTGNTAVGSNSLANNTSGQYNNGVGLNTLNAQTSGANYNNAFGSEALEENTTGDNNSAFGDLAMNRNTTGGANTVMGAQALENNQTGSNNVVVGYQAGESASGSSNVFLGYRAGRTETGSNKLYIENSNSSSPLIYGEFDNDLVRVNGELDVEGNIHTSGNWVSHDGDDEGLYVSTDGNVGIGTSSPNHELQIYDDTNDNAWLQFIQASTGTTSSDGFVIGINSSEEANIINKEATNMNFQTDNTTRMTIDADGRVGFGTTSMDDMLHVSGPDAINTDGTRIRVESSTNGYAGMVAINSERNFFVGVQGSGDPNPGHFHIYDNTAGARRMVITDDGNVGIGYYGPGYRLRINGQVAGNGAYVNASDRKFKTNISPIESAMDKILQLEGVSYDWKTKEFPELTFDDRHQLGFIAQDVEAVVPEAVSITEEGDYGLSYSTFIPLLVEAIKELKAENDALKAELSEEKARNEERLNRLEELLLKVGQ